jgi:RAT1-interacting protein
MRWYYPPRLGLDLSEGYETFVKQDDTVDEHLDSLLETVTSYEQEHKQRIDAHVVTWRGVLTRVRRRRGRLAAQCADTTR